ncbi:sigma-70 family RNA polymerase sigma factor [Kitasatospora azatica]|uniref:sigma-70 family RNA polymerase sigma factor n=1 Tax=Kitasatospora azatica TaxID=58347 RepID=UPI000A86E787|nr:sigma-70 family RNA polymerase sigma factor [Kitasatospora azatica]
MSPTLTAARLAGSAATTANTRTRGKRAARAAEHVDERVMRAVYQEHGAAVLKFALSLIYDRQRAEDVVQETFLRLWRHPEALLAEDLSIRPWLFTVARRIVIDARRAQAVRPQEIGDAELEAQPLPDDAIERVTTRAAFHESMETLSPSHRAVLVELYYRGCSVAEAARRLGVPQGTVKSRSHYALRALRESLTRRGVLAH